MRDSIRCVINIIHFYKQKGIQALALFRDAEKAFD